MPAPKRRTLPDPRGAAAFLDDVLGALFPDHHGDGSAPRGVTRLGRSFLALARGSLSQAVARHAWGRLRDTLPRVAADLSMDVDAAVERDPAATGRDEVILCYPGIIALAAHRFAHEMHRLGVSLIPRLLSEAAHSRTGIDIHPGATIAPHCFIDHGTGVVIGESAVIGPRCTLYQGVTLGALRFEHDPSGRVVRGAKRHPTLGEGVTVYANATILGGATVIGDGSVVGADVFLTESVPPGSKVRGSAPAQAKPTTRPRRGR